MSNQTTPQIEGEKEAFRNTCAVFARSSMMARSPTKVSTVAVQQLHQVADTPAEQSGRTALSDLGEEISKLVEMLEDGKRRSIHQPMRDSIESIRALYELVAIQLRDNRAKAVIRMHQASQTSPIFGKATENKRKQNSVRTPATKRSKGVTTTQTSTCTPATEESEPESVTKGPSRKEGEQWTTVKRKVKKVRQPSKRSMVEKSRPDAIVIAAKGEASYSEILRRVKADSKLSGVGQAVSKIRRTQNGELLLQLSSSGEGTTAFKNLIGESLGEQADVRALSQRVTIECRDLDEITTKEDICEALKKQLLLKTVSADDITIRKAYGSTQTASIKLPVEEAKKALAAGVLKVGWTVSRIREWVNIKNCFKCMEFGHFARDCTSAVDRSKQCRRCGQNDHKAKDCTAKPQCMLCKDNKSRDDHTAGSGKCPVFRRALAQRR